MVSESIRLRIHDVTIPASRNKVLLPHDEEVAVASSIAAAAAYRKQQTPCLGGCILLVVFLVLQGVIGPEFDLMALSSPLDGTAEHTTKETESAAATSILVNETNTSSWTGDTAIAGASRLALTSTATATTHEQASSGRMVLAYSLYGRNTKYTEGMVATAKQVRDIYPGWEVRVYHDRKVPEHILRELADMNHVRLVNVPKDLPEWVSRTVNPASWRFLVASDHRVEAFGIRDADSQPNEREKAAVDEWLQSKTPFHIMRDHPLHEAALNFVILAGMWGGLGSAVSNMDELLLRHYNSTPIIKYGEDQDFLKSEIWPLAKADCFQHDSYYCNESGGVAFPMKREEARDPHHFVGNRANRQPGIVKRDLELEHEPAVSKYKKCLELRATMMAGVDGLPNTSYSGKTIMVSSMRAENSLSQKEMLRKMRERKRTTVKVPRKQNGSF